MIRALDADAYEAAIPGLADLLVDVVAGGASIGFMDGLGAAEATDYWAGLAPVVRAGTTHAFVAMDQERVVGSTLLIQARFPNGSHRAEIAKVLVLRSHRRRGVAGALMSAAEARARAIQRWLLILDTVSGSAAASLYEGLGWQRAGDIPWFATMPDGELVSTTYYWKDLR
ncbi:MAG: GNAT family N-acetyltransferase [Chloroflexota bacterium]